MELERVSFKVDPQLKKECMNRVGNLSVFLRECMVKAVYGDNSQNDLCEVKLGRPYRGAVSTRTHTILPKGEEFKSDELIQETDLLFKEEGNTPKPAFDTMLSKLTGKQD